MAQVIGIVIRDEEGFPEYCLATAPGDWREKIGGRILDELDHGLAVEVGPAQRPAGQLLGHGDDAADVELAHRLRNLEPARPAPRC